MVEEKELVKYSTKELEAELLRRREEKRNIPAFDDTVSAEEKILRLEQFALKTITEALDECYWDDDNDGYIAEQVYLTLFGENFYTWFRDNF